MVPGWLELVRHGAAPLLVFAPHAGRRRARRQPGRHKVNDLHTADIARELAAACGATCLVNPDRDRNEVDLNRITQLRREAPGLVAFFADTLEAFAQAHDTAIVLVVHGWNAIQPVCDVGAGVRESGAALAPAGRGQRTASEAFVRQRVGALRALVEPEGLSVTIGARYPAAHPNNVLQLFTTGPRADDDAARRRLAALAAGGRLHALQLELGIPLRWPGWQRTAFLRGLTRVFDAPRGRSGSRDSDAPSGRVPPPLASGGTVSVRRAVQFVDGPVMGLAGIEAGAHGAIAGRLLISTTPHDLALFTGEVARRDAGPWVLPPLVCTEIGTTLALRYLGTMLRFPTLTPFLDLEQGLALGRLLAADVDLHVTSEARSAAGPAFAEIRGTVVLDGFRHLVDTVALLSSGDAGTPAVPPALRLVLPGTRLGHLTLVSREPIAGAAGARTFSVQGQAWTSARASAVAGTAELDDGELAVVVADGTRGQLRCRASIERRIPVRRPGRRGTVVQTTYGLCRFADQAPGWLELTVEEPADVVAAD